LLSWIFLKAVEEAFDAIKPDVVVHAASLTDVDKVNSTRSWLEG
jgi:dTDP-4-dehydrorhamnose reductase